MKTSRHKKILGLALGDRSLLAAEVIAQEHPQVTRLAEWAYPGDLWPADAAQVGAALGPFLRMQGFAGRAAVVGIGLKWMLAKPAQVPATDAATLAGMLRLKAEAIFSADFKDMALEYTGSGPVLLLGTPGKYIDAASALCRAAGLQLLAVTPTALALGAAVAGPEAARSSALVLAVQGEGAELSALRQGTTEAMQYLRGPTAGGAFVSELRRTLSGWPAAAGGARELVLWDGGAVDTVALAGALGVKVRSGALPALGVHAAATGANGEASKYGGAVALALCGLRPGGETCDFLHSRLAPPKERRLPRWTAAAVIAGVVLLAAGIYGYVDLARRQGEVTALQQRLDAAKDAVDAAQAFVTKVSFAQGWEADAPRYLACMRDLTMACPDDGQTYATSLILRDSSHPAGGGAAAAQSQPKGVLSGQLSGKTTDQDHVQMLLDRVVHMRAFSEVKLSGAFVAGRGREVSFSIAFNYAPPGGAVIGPHPSPLPVYREKGERLELS